MGSEHRLTLILSIGRDPALLSTRHLLLQSAGYIVESAHSIDDGIKRFHDGDFDLVLMCHSLSDEERMRFSRSIREDGSSIPVVFVTANADSHQNRSGNANSGTDPDELLHNVEVLSQPERSLRTGIKS